MSVEQELNGALHVAFDERNERVIALFQVEPEWFAVNLGWIDEEYGEDFLEWSLEPYNVLDYDSAFEIFTDLIEREFVNV